MGGPGSGGANRKPTALKVLHGDDKKNPQRINRNEPVPGDQPVSPPAMLTPGGLEVWERMAPDRIAKGVLTAWDTDAFRLFCEAVAAAHESVACGGRVFREAVATAVSLGARFGWTPADRARLVVGGENRDQKERLLS